MTGMIEWKHDHENSDYRRWLTSIERISDVQSAQEQVNKSFKCEKYPVLLRFHIDQIGS
jgi:hypothetical protein